MREFIQRFILKPMGDFARLLILGANCSHAVLNLIRVNNRIHRCPQKRISDHGPSHRGLRSILFPNRVWVLVLVWVLGTGAFRTSTVRRGLRFYCPYPRSLTIRRCHYKGNTFVAGLNLRLPAQQSGYTV